jgi:hypothetical protein
VADLSTEGGKFVGGVVAGSIGSAVEAVAAAAKAAAALAERAQQGQLIDAGQALALATTLQAINEKLQAFKVAADRVDTDAGFADLVRSAFTLPDC